MKKELKQEIKDNKNIYLLLFSELLRLSDSKQLAKTVFNESKVSLIDPHPSGLALLQYVYCENVKVTNVNTNTICEVDLKDLDKIDGLVDRAKKAFLSISKQPELKKATKNLALGAAIILLPLIGSGQDGPKIDKQTAIEFLKKAGPDFEKYTMDSLQTMSMQQIKQLIRKAGDVRDELDPTFKVGDGPGEIIKQTSMIAPKLLKKIEVRGGDKTAFQKAFAKAYKAGREEFEFKGKMYKVEIDPNHKDKVQISKKGTEKTIWVPLGNKK